MFDTGSPEYFFISPADFEGAKRNGGVQKTISRVGSIGNSIGGRAPHRNQHMVQLRELVIGNELGNVQLDRVGGPLRGESPSLIGASILQHFIVTLDLKNSMAYFKRFNDGPYVRSSYGFGFDFDETVSVSVVWDDSAASAAGLRVGQRVTSINGQRIDTYCNGVRRALRSLSSATLIRTLYTLHHTRDESREK